MYTVSRTQAPGEASGTTVRFCVLCTQNQPACSFHALKSAETLLQAGAGHKVSLPACSSS